MTATPTTPPKALEGRRPRARRRRSWVLDVDRDVEHEQDGDLEQQRDAEHAARSCDGGGSRARPSARSRARPTPASRAEIPSSRSAVSAAKKASGAGRGRERGVTDHRRVGGDETDRSLSPRDAGVAAPALRTQAGALGGNSEKSASVSAAIRNIPGVPGPLLSAKAIGIDRDDHRHRRRRGDHHEDDVRRRQRAGGEPAVAVGLWRSGGDHIGRLRQQARMAWWGSSLSSPSSLSRAATDH